MAGTADAHGSAFGVEEVANIKRSVGLNPEQHHYIPQDVYDFFSDIPARGKSHEADWEAVVAKYEQEHPDLAKEFALRVQGKMPTDWTKCIPSKDSLPSAAEPSRKSAGNVGVALAENIPNFMIGTADLSPSVNLSSKKKVDFQSPDVKVSSGPNGRDPSSDVDSARSGSHTAPSKVDSVVARRYGGAGASLYTAEEQH